MKSSIGELVDSRVVESPNGGMVGCWSFSNRRIVDWSDGVVGSSISGIVDSLIHRMVDSWTDGVDEWSNGGMAELSYCRIVEGWSCQIIV